MGNHEEAIGLLKLTGAWTPDTDRVLRLALESAYVQGGIDAIDRQLARIRSNGYAEQEQMTAATRHAEARADAHE